jgi:FkbM family methyltransferase
METATRKLPQAARVVRGKDEAIYLTPNEVTLGRAQTLFTKEPITVQWIDSMHPGDILYDVGANVGMYTIWAGKRGVKVYAFEPEAENHALLSKNIAINKLDSIAYCMAISDKFQVNELHLSREEVGRSCHSFGEAVGPTLQPREGPKQGCVGMSLDNLVKSGMPVPNHIKIDVDGFEHKVIEGAKKTLAKPGVKSVLIELNPAMETHAQVIQYFAESGWYCDPEQVRRATRPHGEWKGYAEHLFHKFTPVAQYTLDRIREAPVLMDPFPHIYVAGVWHPAVYRALLEAMPDDYQTIEEVRGVKGYPERYVSHPAGELWSDLRNFMLSGALRQALSDKFGVVGTKEETLLIRDLPGYKIGPHTDSARKVLSALFYLPRDASHHDQGTSLYKPKAEGFTCPGGTHHPFEPFERVKTMPFLPNSLFAFPKSDVSFHGVEPSTCVRDVLLYDIQK